MDRQQQAAARQVFTFTEKAGIRLPKPVLDARAKVDKIRAGVALIPPFNRDGVAIAVADALARDADPAFDPKVARAIALAAITMPAVIDNVESAAFELLWEACREEQDALVDELRKPFDKAAAVLVAAHKRIGDLDLKADSQAILKLGTDVAAVWAGAIEADREILDIIVAWNSLSRFLSGTGGTADARWVNLRLVNPPAEVWNDLDLERNRLDPWDAVRAGLALTLPTLTGVDERRAAIAAQRAELAAAAAAAATPAKTGAFWA